MLIWENFYLIIVSVSAALLSIFFYVLRLRLIFKKKTLKNLQEAQQTELNELQDLINQPSSLEEQILKIQQRIEGSRLDYQPVDLSLEELSSLEPITELHSYLVKEAKEASYISDEGFNQTLREKATTFNGETFKIFTKFKRDFIEIFNTEIANTTQGIGEVFSERVTPLLEQFSDIIDTSVNTSCLEAGTFLGLTLFKLLATAVELSPNLDISASLVFQDCPYQGADFLNLLREFNADPEHPTSEFLALCDWFNTNLSKGSFDALTPDFGLQESIKSLLP